MRIHHLIFASLNHLANIYKKSNMKVYITKTGIYRNDIASSQSGLV